MTQQTFKALAAFLLYPTEEQQKALGECLDIIKAENLLKDEHIKGLSQLANYIASNDIYDIQAAYINLFDRGRSYSLHLFEHVHGESRDRGQAMVDLTSTYAQAGLELDGNELPDYLPIFLEYLAEAPKNEAEESLADAAHIIAIIGARLSEAESPYAHVFSAIVALSPQQPNKDEIAKAIQTKEDRSLESLDQAWEEKPAFDGEADCGRCEHAISHDFLGQEEIGARNE
ncbi:MAG: nitrate reductase molybdenum cofactor assembly chaperone [Alphaproteobacteria bacterium]